MEGVGGESWVAGRRQAVEDVTAGAITGKRRGCFDNLRALG
jgi:hypothetical protein